MGVWTLFSRSKQAQIAPASNSQKKQGRRPSGSWLAYGLALITAFALIFSAGAQNVAYGYQLGAYHSEFRAVVLALASGGATLLAPICFEAVRRCIRQWKMGVSAVALALGLLAFGYSSACSLGFVAGGRDLGIASQARQSDLQEDRKALAKAAHKELTSLKGQHPRIVERRRELTKLLASLSEKGTAERPVAKSDSQAAAFGFYLRAAGYRVGDDAVGTWLNLGMVLFLELAAALSLVVAGSLRPVRQVVSAAKPADDKRDKDDPPSLPPAKRQPIRVRGKVGRPATVTQSQALHRLQAAGGSLSGSLSAIAGVIGAKSRTTAHSVLHQLAKAGSIKLETTPHGCSVAVVP